MPYLTLSDLGYTSFARRISETFKQIEVPQAVADPEAGYTHAISSNAPYSMYNAANTDRSVQVLSELTDSAGTRYDFNMNMSQYIIPRSSLKKVYDRMKAERLESINSEPMRYIQDPVYKGIMDDFKTGWVRGAQSYMGWALAWEPVALASSYRNSPIKGIATVMWNKQPVGTLRYYWGKIAEKELIIDPMTPSYAMTPENVLHRFDLSPVKELFRVNLKFGGTDIQLDSGVYAAQKGVIAGSPSMYNHYINPTFEFMPAIQEQIHDYWNIPDMGLEAHEYIKKRYGYDDVGAAEELQRLIAMKVQFPVEKAEEIWNWYLERYGDKAESKVRRFSPNNADAMIRLMNRTPVYGWLMFEAEDMQKLLKTVPADKMVSFMSELKLLMKDIEEREITAFNYTLLNYVGEGFCPETFYGKALTEYNDRITKGRERKERWALLASVLTLALSAVPVMGMTIAATIGTFGAYSNLMEIKAQQRKQEESIKEIEQIYEETGIEETVYAPQPERKKMGMLAWTGIIAAAVAGYFTLT